MSIIFTLKTETLFKNLVKILQSEPFHIENLKKLFLDIELKNLKLVIFFILPNNSSLSSFIIACHRKIFN